MIAATNKPLEEAIAAGTFREDLLYRLNVFTIFVPPLRDRKTDILLLADHFLERLAADHRKRIRRIATPAIDMLMAYHWPGNVRELQNVMERAVLVCDGEVVHAHHLPPTLQMADTGEASATQALTTALAAYEKDLIQDALKMARETGPRPPACCMPRHASSTTRSGNTGSIGAGSNSRRIRVDPCNPWLELHVHAEVDLAHVPDRCGLAEERRRHRPAVSEVVGPVHQIDHKNEECRRYRAVP